MWDSVDEVRETDKGGREADCWAVECGDEDLGVVEESAGEVDVVYEESSEDVTAKVAAVMTNSVLDIRATFVLKYVSRCDSQFGL